MDVITANSLLSMLQNVYVDLRNSAKRESQLNRLCGEIRITTVGSTIMGQGVLSPTNIASGKLSSNYAITEGGNSKWLQILRQY
jgi:hypothetical protein